MYDAETVGGGKLAVATGNLREALAEIERLKSSALAKAYADRPGGTGDPVFDRMVAEFGVADGAAGQALYTRMDTIVLQFGDGEAAAKEALLLLDLFA